jgi:N-acylneuraminate cytidylyltransferase
MPNVVALIPARGGSKGIPRKNLERVGGVPLVVRSIRHAQAVSGISAVYVSTDDSQIAEVARQAGARIIDRPAQIAGDQASTESAIADALAQLARMHVEADAMVLLQCTSPFRSEGQLTAALDRYFASGAESLLSVTRDHSFFWQPTTHDHGAKAINYQPASRPRRQDHGGWLRETGSFYIFSTAMFRQTNSRLGGRIEAFEVPARDALEIDDPHDLALARAMWQSRGEAPVPIEAANLRWLVLDVDGTLTDGRMIYGEDGNESKSFHARDGHGIARWRAAGGKVAWISGEAVDLVMRRASKLNIDFVALGCKDKNHALDVLIREHGADPSTMLAMGDDILDLPFAQRCALFVAPADASSEIASMAAWLTQARGGEGAVREVIDTAFAAGALAQPSANTKTILNRVA